jgi:hypothetical protein
MPHVLEPANLNQDSNIRPDGMTYVFWRRGKLLVWDVTVTSSVSPSHVPHSSRTPGWAARQSELLKMRKYRCLCEEYIVQPVALECHGTPGPMTETFIEEISKRLVETTSDPRAGLYFEQAISMTLQRGNVRAILSTMGAVEDATVLHL